jgi:hypothetical protein
MSKNEHERSVITFDEIYSPGVPLRFRAPTVYDVVPICGHCIITFDRHKSGALHTPYTHQYVAARPQVVLLFTINNFYPPCHSKAQGIKIIVDRLLVSKLVHDLNGQSEFIEVFKSGSQRS